MAVHHVKDEADLEAQLTEAGSKLVVIDFFATWCGPCKHMTPRVEELAGVESEVVFLKVDVDECEAIAGSYSISSMPTFVFVKNKKRMDDFSGANIEKLKEFIGKLKAA